VCLGILLRESSAHLLVRLEMRFLAVLVAVRNAVTFGAVFQ
jgi:hypothetical protein